MKKFTCGSVVPGCEWHTRADSEAEIISRVVDHLRETHGETIIRESMIERIKSSIDEEKNAA